MWFNAAAFAVNDVGTFGDVARGAYYGPNLHSWDMGLFKNFRMGTDMNMQFRAEFFNVFNQVNFDIPNTEPQRRQLRRHHAHGPELRRSAHYSVRPEVRVLNHERTKEARSTRGEGRRLLTLFYVHATQRR